MVTNLQAAMLYKFLTGPTADVLVMTLKGNVAVQRNIRKLKDFFESVVALEEKHKIPSSGYKEFEIRRNALIQEYAAKDDKGNVIQVPGGGIQLQEGVEEFQKEFEDLTRGSQEFIDEHTEKLKEWEEYVQLECDLDIVMVKESDVQFSELSKKDFEQLMVMIESEEESEESSEEPVETPKDSEA